MDDKLFYLSDKDKALLAAFEYDNMMEAYRNFINDTDDEDSADKFLDAALLLCELGMPNPFHDLKDFMFEQNAAKRPGEGHIVTAVAEQ